MTVHSTFNAWRARHANRLRTGKPLSLEDFEGIYFLAHVEGGELHVAPLGSPLMDKAVWVNLGTVRTNSTERGQHDPQ